MLAEDGGEHEGGDCETDDRRESESHGGLGGLRYLDTSFIRLVPPLWTVNICTNIFRKFLGICPVWPLKFEFAQLDRLDMSPTRTLCTLPNHTKALKE